MASQSQANVAPIPAPALGPAPRRPFSDEALLLTDAPAPGRLHPPAIRDHHAEVDPDGARRCERRGDPRLVPARGARAGVAGPRLGSRGAERVLRAMDALAGAP